MIAFDVFWNAYGVKRDRIAAERAWKRLSAKDRKAAFDGIAAYRDDCTARGIRMMYAQGYINHRRWEDERDDDSSSRSDISPLLPLEENTKDAAKDAANAALAAFKEEMSSKSPCKQFMWDEYLRVVIEPLSIASVDGNGMIHLCLEREGSSRERVTDYMIDFYDSYKDFLRIIGKHFDIRKLTFDI